MGASRDRARKPDERTCPGAHRETAKVGVWVEGRGGSFRSHRHIMSLIALTFFSLLPSVSSLAHSVRLCSHHQPHESSYAHKTLMCLSEKMPNHFNNISCHLCFHRGLRVCPSVGWKQTVISDKRNGNAECRPIRFNHLWRNVILEDTRAEWVDMGIRYYAKRRVHPPRIWIYEACLWFQSD